ncbi:acyl-CoA N-acyltransferase [Dendryphion nanum]|uniref:Acyl-CoA N-acyltransferase n=1 Tax=Dendryphion nanum TaxID=256645 RepID=A0A9P9IPF0_9PLEO|nr:acyl-CoA N-acyltransferase [Dendryphion nanum]
MMTAVTRQAEFPNDLDAIRSLFTEYAASLGIDLSYQSFEAELSSLPGKYSASQGGTILLTETHTGGVVGCASLRRLSSRSNACELKRFYLVPETRGLGLGKRLLESIIKEARKLRYEEMLLDTLSSMVAARKMYKGFGFEETKAYYETPIQDTVFLRLDLGKGQAWNLRNITTEATSAGH